MILFVRKYFHKNVMKALILVTAFSLVGMGLFTGIVSLFYSSNSTVFSVNGITVSKPIFALRAATEKRIIEFYQEQLGGLAPQFLAQVGLSMSAERNAYNKLLQELVLSSCMERSGLHVNPRFIAQKAYDPMLLMNIFGTMPRSLFDRSGKLQQEILLKILMNIGLTMEDFERALEEAVERDLALSLFHLAVPITEKEIEAHIIKEDATRQFNLSLYSLSEYIKKEKESGVTPEGLEAFYQEHNKRARRYWEAEKRSGSSWKIPVTEKNREKIVSEAQELLNGQEKPFNDFIQRHKGIKSVLKEQVLKPTEQQSSMLFKLESGNKGIYQDEGSVVIVMPTHIIPAVEKPFQEVEKQVAQDYYLAMAQKAFVEDLEGPGIGDQHKVTTKKIIITPESKEKEFEKLNQESIATDRVKNMITQGAILRGVTDKGGYAMVLEKIEKPGSLSPERSLAIRKAVYKDNDTIITAASVDSLLKNAKIKGNKTIESSTN